MHCPLTLSLRLRHNLFAEGTVSDCDFHLVSIPIISGNVVFPQIVVGNVELGYGLPFIHCFVTWGCGTVTRKKLVRVQKAITAIQMDASGTIIQALIVFRITNFPATTVHAYASSLSDKALVSRPVSHPYRFSKVFPAPCNILASRSVQNSTTPAGMNKRYLGL